MALENLYRCTQEDLTTLTKDLTTAFFEDDLYLQAFPNEKTRRACMEHYFRNYIEAIAPDCIFLADSEEKNCIMVVYDSRRYQRKAYMKRLLKMNLQFTKFLFMMGVKSSIHLLKEWDMFSSRWISNFVHGPYFHLDLIFTKQAMRGKGIGERMVRELIDEGDIMDMDVTVETHHRENAIWYERLGFVLMNTIIDEQNELHQYCLVVHHAKE